MGVEIDPNAIEILQENCADFEVAVDVINCDVEKLRLRDRPFDTIIMNPPFGTKTQGIGIRVR